MYQGKINPKKENVTNNTNYPSCIDSNGWVLLLFIVLLAFLGFMLHIISAGCDISDGNLTRGGLTLLAMGATGASLASYLLPMLMLAAICLPGGQFAVLACAALIAMSLAMMLAAVLVKICVNHFQKQYMTVDSDGRRIKTSNVWGIFWEDERKHQRNFNAAWVDARNNA